jgi:hypothetical protein
MDVNPHQWHQQNEYGNGKTTARGWPQYNTTPVHEYGGLDFEKLAYIGPGPPPPTSATSISTTVTPLTTAGDSTLRHLLTDDDRRHMCEYHESHLGNRILSHGIQFSTIKRNEKWIEQEDT